MSGKQPRENALVKRITVDERVADDLIRVLTCCLAEGVRAFFDRPKYWGEEREVLVQSSNYAQEFSVPLKEAPAWETLEEGQVFLVGEFEAVLPEGVSNGTPPKYFRVSRGQKRVQRADDLKDYRKSAEQMYPRLLTRMRGRGRRR